MYTGLIGRRAGTQSRPALEWRTTTWLPVPWSTSIPNRLATVLRSSIRQSRGLRLIRARILEADGMNGTIYGTTYALLS